jgi:hypothetical protein
MARRVGLADLEDQAHLLERQGAVLDIPELKGAIGQTGHRRGEPDAHRHRRGLQHLLADRPPDLCPDPVADLGQELRLVLQLAVRGRVVSQVRVEVHEGLVERSSPIERHCVVGEKGAAGVRQPPAPMVEIGIVGHLQLQLIHRVS